MQIKLAVLADYATTTGDGKLVVGGIFDVLRAQQVPTMHPRASLALRLHVLPEEGRNHELKVQYVDPDGKKLLELGGPLSVHELHPENGADAQFVMNFEPLPVEAYGRHAFDIFLDGEYAETVALDVVEMKPQPRAEESTGG